MTGKTRATKPKTTKKKAPELPQKGKMTLQQQANEILKQAEERGVNSNFFFATTFKRYQVQMQILTDLEKAIAEHGMIVSKEYVKGRQNLVTNPAITEYNKTATAANGTVSTLINIIKYTNWDIFSLDIKATYATTQNTKNKQPNMQHNRHKNFFI